MHSEFKPGTQEKERQTHTVTHTEWERKAGKDQLGYSSSNNGEKLVADANKAGDASRFEQGLTSHQTHYRS